MALGSAITNKFPIGTAEMRFGPQTLAMSLTQADHSAGLLDQVTVNIAQESATLEGGFPRKLVDSAIIRQTAELTATMREYSRRNIRMLSGEGSSGTAPTDFSGTVDGIVAAAAVLINVATGEGASITAGDYITTWPAGEPEKMTVCLIDSISVDALTLNAGTPVTYGLADGSPYFISHQLPVGDVSQTNYMAITVIQKENSTGRPTVWHFWKASVSSGLEVANNAEDFASTELTLSLLEPSAADYGAGGALVHLASVIPSHPIGMYANGADA